MIEAGVLLILLVVLSCTDAAEEPANGLGAVVQVSCAVLESLHYLHCVEGRLFKDKVRRWRPWGLLGGGLP